MEREIDQLQRKMTAIILSVRMQQHEIPESFARRRNRLIKSTCNTEGLWSKRHCRRIINWRDHILRPANASSWAAALYNYRGADWLMAQRAEHGTSVFGGRTGTRLAPGFVATRWHDGVDYAIKYLEGSI